jgi:hypothetical protein
VQDARRFVEAFPEFALAGGRGSQLHAAGAVTKVDAAPSGTPEAVPVIGGQDDAASADAPPELNVQEGSRLWAGRSDARIRNGYRVAP